MSGTGHPTHRDSVPAVLSALKLCCDKLGSHIRICCHWQSSTETGTV